jgi:UDP-N-acetylmuramate: L-alanyl-gamma-D-glutamyl-meso-diaminopimelate ligase
MVVLDPKLNVVPEKVRHVHLMGICGTGMGALAGMLQSAGFHVSGSDANVYPPMSDFLASLSIPVSCGYRAENLSSQPDLVVVGNVITAKNPEAAELARLAIPYLSFPQALSHYFIGDKISLVICGTHGKTTTSSMLASLLQKTDHFPSFMIGGLVQAFGRNYNVSHGEYFVAEGDEYDTAFFDKGPKFLHYRPRIAILTSIEFDHADIYRDLQAVKESFRRLVDIMPADGRLVACMDDENVQEIVTRANCPVIGYGEGKNCRWRLESCRVGKGETVFSALFDGEPYGEFRLPMPGRHNALNSLAVIAVLQHLGIPRGAIEDGLACFEGVRRRQEVRGVVGGITVIDDFAHHPTAVQETLDALKQAYVGQRLIAVFEPRTNSSRRKVFQERYVQVFDGADLVIVKEQEPLANVAPEERFSCRQLVDDLKSKGAEAAYFADTAAIIEYLARTAREGDVVAVLSNGGFDNIHSRLLERLGQAGGTD